MASAREWEELSPAVSERELLPAAVESVLAPAVFERELLPAAVESVLAPAVSERELLPAAVESVLAHVAVPEYLGTRVVAARSDPYGTLFVTKIKAQCHIITFYCTKPPNIKAPKCTLFSIQCFNSRVKGHKGSPVFPWLLASIVGGSSLRRAHFKSLRAAEAKNAAAINHRSRSYIMENIALGAWSRANKALSCGSRPRPRAIFPVMHSHGTLTSI